MDETPHLTDPSEAAAQGLVEWYERPGWPLRRLTPEQGLCLSFGLGALTGVAAVLLIARLRD